MNARYQESALLSRCAAVAQGDKQPTKDRREANVLRLAALALGCGENRVIEFNNLVKASDQYFAAHPDEKMETQEVHVEVNSASTRLIWLAASKQNQSHHRFKGAPTPTDGKRFLRG